jgi:hypothetical protein
MQNFPERNSFFEHQILQLGLICAASLVNCEAHEFPCLVINLIERTMCMETEPKLEKPLTVMHKQNVENHKSKIKRLQLL